MFGVIAAVCYIAFAHLDIHETAVHAHMLLECVADGNFFGFFERTAIHDYGYNNAAHYNILMYILYALWELPIYIIERLSGTTASAFVLAFWCKAIGTAFYLGCGVLTARLAKMLGAGEAQTAWAPLLFWLSPVAFFTTLVMGQYDSICLFFMLLAFVFYFKKDYTKFTLVMGVGIVFKFFPVFVLIPLLLLVEKRPLHLLKYGVLSLWLYVPTALLFLGRTGDAGSFNMVMVDRLFARSFDGGLASTSWFLLVLVAVFVLAYLYRPKNDAALRSAAVYAALCVFSALFIFMQWHPQWLILLVPFSLITTLTSKNQTAFIYLEIAFCIGFFVLMFSIFPASLEGNLIDWGLLRGLVRGVGSTKYVVKSYVDLIPHAGEIAGLLFYAPLFLGMVLKLPLGGKTLADKISNGQDAKISHRAWAWGVFAVCFGGAWLVPTLFTKLFPWFYEFARGL